MHSEAKSNPWQSSSSWLAELTVDGINPKSALIEWSPGDSYQQGILVGADLVYGFRPLSEAYKLTDVNTTPESSSSSSLLNSSQATPIVFRSGIVGCFRDITVNSIKPPYQVNLVPEQAKSVLGLSSNPFLMIVRTQNCQTLITSSLILQQQHQHQQQQQQNMLNKMQHTTANSNYRYAFALPSSSNINHDSKKLMVCLHGGSCQDSPSGPQCVCPAVPLIPDTNPLGLSQFHIYIIVGLLAFLFLTALATIVLLACRARGMFGGTLDGSRRSVKSAGSYWPNGNHQQTKPIGRSSDPRLNRLNYSAGGSLSGVPFIAGASPAHPGGHASHIGTHPRYMLSAGHRRPSLASSAFGFPVAMDDSATALLNSNSGHMPFSSESVKLGGNCNAAATLGDYSEHDDSVATCNSGVLLYPTAVGDHQMPVMMMLSPLPGTHGSVGPGSRASVIARYSPASSVIFYGPGVPSGSVTPTNQIHSPQPGFGVDPSGSGYIPQRQCFTGSQVALYPTGHPAFLPHPQSQQHHQQQQQLIQMVNMRPNSVVGSDRLSLGSGSDRFSAHSSQVLVQPNSTCAIPYPCCPQSQAVTPQLYYHQSSAAAAAAAQHHRSWTPNMSSNGHAQPNFLIMNQNHDEANLEEACMTLRPQNTDSTKTNDANKSQANCDDTPAAASSDDQPVTTHNSNNNNNNNNNSETVKPRPVPVNLQHTTSAFVLKQRQHPIRQQNNNNNHHISPAFNTLHAMYPCCCAQPLVLPISSSNACCKPTLSHNNNNNTIFPMVNPFAYSSPRCALNSFLHPRVRQPILVVHNPSAAYPPFTYSYPSIHLQSMPIPEDDALLLNKSSVQNSESLFHLPDSCPTLHDDTYNPTTSGLKRQSMLAAATTTSSSSSSRGIIHQHHRPPVDDKAFRRTLQPREILKANVRLGGGLPPVTVSRPHSAHLLGLKITTSKLTNVNGNTSNNSKHSDAQPNCKVRNSIVGEANGGCVNVTWLVNDNNSSLNHIQNNNNNNSTTKDASNVVPSSTTGKSNTTQNTTNTTNGNNNNNNHNNNVATQNRISNNKLDWFGNDNSNYHPLLQNNNINNNTSNSYELINGNHKDFQNVSSEMGTPTTTTPVVAVAQKTPAPLTNGLSTAATTTATPTPHVKQLPSSVNNSCHHDSKSISSIDDL
ncbi:unnamed protein product [Trichobilharzia regenti]|nr:unnamed protein product [Trichobilharzia regenti]